MPPTNAPTNATNAPAVPAAAMDLRTFGRMFLGRQPGYKPTPEEFEADKKAYDYYIKQAIDNRFDPEILNTQQGMYARYDGTNAVAIAPMTTNAQGQVVRGEPLRGYAAGDPAETGVVPTAGGGMFGVSNAATPTATPTPSPTPYPEGATLRKRSGENAGKLHKVVNGVPQLIPGQ